MSDIPSPNLQALISSPYLVDNTTFPREPVYTELARSILAKLPATPLSAVFPDETIAERIVIAEHVIEGVNTIFPVVEWGAPDLFVDDDGYTVYRQSYQPLPIRQSMYMSYAQLNNTVREGTTNERATAAEQIEKKLTRQMQKHQLTWNVFQAAMMLGGINYTDPRSGVRVKAPAYIPARNFFNFNTTQGYRGRNEARLFRNLIDLNAGGTPSSGVPITDPQFALSNFVRRLNRWFKDTNKSDITDMYVGPEMRDVILMSEEARLAQGGIIPRLGAVFGDSTIDSNDSGGSFGPLPPGGLGTGMGLVLGTRGDIVSIAGVNFHVVDTIYKDPVDGVEKRVWPKNKIVAVSFRDSDGNVEAPGRTQYCSSENSIDSPGLWTRTVTDVPPPAAPGIVVQMGNAGLPYFKFPYRVCHVTPCTVEQINERLGIQGELFFPGL